MLKYENILKTLLSCRHCSSINYCKIIVFCCCLIFLVFVGNLQ